MTGRAQGERRFAGPQTAALRDGVLHSLLSRIEADLDDPADAGAGWRALLVGGLVAASDRQQQHGGGGGSHALTTQREPCWLLCQRPGAANWWQMSLGHAGLFAEWQLARWRR